jgi:hypothetical protein
VSEEEYNICCYWPLVHHCVWGGIHYLLLLTSCIPLCLRRNTIVVVIDLLYTIASEEEYNNNKYCIPPQTQWCTRGQYKTNIFDWQLMVSKTDFIYTHTNHVNLKNIIRIRSWKQSVYIWHINQNIWEVDTSFKRVFCFVFRGPHFVSVIHCLLSSSTFHIWILSSGFRWHEL